MPRAERTSDEPATAPAGSTARADRRTGGRRRAPRPTVILLVRHGATTTTGRELPGRAPGLHLSDQGRAQAEQVAARIAALAGVTADGDGHGGRDGAASTNGRTARAGRSTRRKVKGGGGPTITAVYASPLERTRETAAPIARVLGRDVAVDDGLVEVDVGEWTGLELKVARKRKEWATIQRYPSGFTFPGGESFVAMQARITATLDRLRGAHPGETIVAVSHADPIRAAVAHAMGTHLDMFQRVVVSPCSLTAIAFGDEGPTVLTVNECALGAPVPS
jgi:broad specificity phosphatase PhoE